MRLPKFRCFSKNCATLYDKRQTGDNRKVLFIPKQLKGNICVDTKKFNPEIDPMHSIIFTLLILYLTINDTIAQVPAKAEDISPLLISEKIPDVGLKTIEGESVTLTNIIREKRSVLLFYRGGWCPYCNAHLSAVGEVEEDILALNYQVIAISPDSPGKLKSTTEKQSLNYGLYSDASGALITSMGLAFKAPDRYENRLGNYSDGQNPGILPVPSLFVVDTDGTILFEYINPDYKQRISADLLLAVLKNQSSV